MTVGYSVCLSYDTDRLHKAGSTIPLKLEVCTAGGQNLSSPSIVVHATQLLMVSTAASGEVEDAGQANPNDDFRYTGPAGGGGEYMFNLQTTGLSQGTYHVMFTIDGVPATTRVPFKIR